MCKIRFYASIFVALVCVTSFLSCDNDDDDSDGNNCLACLYSYHELNSKCTIDGESYHTGTSMAQFRGDTRGSFMNIYIHKDSGGLKPASYHNIDLTISPSTGPSIHYIQVGQSLQLSNGIDKIDYWYDTVDLFNIDFNKDTKVSYKQYISGTVTCTKKIGTETTLTFNNVVLRNSDNETKVTINGTFVCDEF